jgi:hypothetical protein
MSEVFVSTCNFLYPSEFRLFPNSDGYHHLDPNSANHHHRSKKNISKKNISKKYFRKLANETD